MAERIDIDIDSYHHMVKYLGNDDSTTSDLLISILAVEEEHANDLADLLEELPGKD